MNSFHKISLGIVFGLAALFVVNHARAQLNVLSTLSCSGIGVTAVCNAQCSSGNSFTENRSFYFNGGFIGGGSTWDDVISFSATLNGSIVASGTGGTATCDQNASGGSGSLPAPSIYTGWQDNDTVAVNLQALNKKNDPSNPTPWGGSTNYVVYSVSCGGGQFTLNSVCTWVDGRIGASLTNCREDDPCSPVITWTMNAGLDAYVTRNSLPWSTANSGSQADSNLPAGTYIYQIFVQDGAGTYLGTDGVTVTVDPPPPPSPPICSPNPASVPVNQNITFTGSSGDGTYIWTAPGGSPSSGSGVNFTTQYNVATSYQVKVTSGDGQSGVCSVTVTAGPPPVDCTPNGIQAVLTGSPVNFQVSGGAAPYNWSAPGANSTSQVSPTTLVATYNSPGNYTVTVTDSIPSSDSCSVTVSNTLSPPSCSATPSSVAVNQSVTFTGSSGDGTYIWSAPGGSPSSGAGVNFPTQYNSAGSYTVTVTSSGQSASCPVTVTSSAIPTISCPSPSTKGPPPQSFTFSVSGGTGAIEWKFKRSTDPSFGGVVGSASSWTSGFPLGNFEVGVWVGGVFGGQCVVNVISSVGPPPPLLPPPPPGGIDMHVQNYWHIPSVSPEYQVGRDYDNDGEMDYDDSLILANVAGGSATCPSGKDCSPSVSAYLSYLQQPISISIAYLNGTLGNRTTLDATMWATSSNLGSSFVRRGCDTNLLTNPPCWDTWDINNNYGYVSASPTGTRYKRTQYLYQYQYLSNCTLGNHNGTYIYPDPSWQTCPAPPSATYDDNDGLTASDFAYDPGCTSVISNIFGYLPLENCPASGPYPLPVGASYYAAHGASLYPNWQPPIPPLFTTTWFWSAGSQPMGSRLVLNVIPPSCSAIFCVILNGATNGQGNGAGTWAQAVTGNAPLTNVTDFWSRLDRRQAFVSYNFYCNRSDAGTNIGTPDFVSGPVVQSNLGRSDNSYIALNRCNYSAPGTYTAKVIATVSAYTAEARIPITVIAPPPPPAAPSNFQADNSTCGQVSLTWTDNSANETGFHIWRNPPNNPPNISYQGTDYNQAATLGANTNSYVSGPASDAPSPGNSYSYIVTSYNTSVESAVSGQNYSGTVQVNACSPNLSLSTISINQVNGVAYTNQPIKNGDLVRFRIAMSNTGSAPAANLYVVHTALKNLTYANYAVCSGCTSPATPSVINPGSQQTVRWNRASDLGDKLNDGNNWNLDFEVTVSSNSTQPVDFFQNQAVIYYDGGSYAVPGGPWLMQTGNATVPIFREVAP